MKKYFFLTSILLLFFFSCKKNKDNPPQSTGTKLAKVVSMDGQTTQTTLYTYDADGRLATIRQTESGGGVSSQAGFRIVRKAGGLIDRVIFLQSGSTDSTTLVVGSNRQQYSSVQWNETVGTATVTHQTTFTFKGQGQIAEAIETDISGGTPDPRSRTTFAYTSNNLTSMKRYRISGGTNILAYQYDLEYDQKPNPLPFGAEWIILSTTFDDFYWQSSANNFTKLTFTQTGNPPETYAATYTYNGKGFPVSASFKWSDPGMPASTSTFTYE